MNINHLKRVIVEQDNSRSMSDMIDEKLKEFNFYTASDKGKQTKENK
jgi:hypothetical protein